MYACVFSVSVNEHKDAGFCEDAGGDIAAQLRLEQESISPIDEIGFPELVIRAAQVAGTPRRQAGQCRGRRFNAGFSLKRGEARMRGPCGARAASLFL